MGSYEANAMQNLSITVDTIPALRGAGLAYVGNNICIATRDSRHSSGLKTFVVVKEGQITASEAKAKMAAPPSMMTEELVGLGLNCSAAAVGALAIAGSGAAVPFTFGTSGAVSYAIAFGTVATFIQCGDSMVRTISVAANQEAWIRELDTQWWYESMSKLCDVASMAAVGATATKAVFFGQLMRSSAAATKSWMQMLKRLTVSERKKLTKEVVRYVYPKVKDGKEFRQAKAALKFPQILSQADIDKEIQRQLGNAVGTAFDIASNDTLTKGKVKSYLVNVWQE
jgi:hypothetical protein